ncbi:FK506-binding protein 5-like [Mytilus edulis]|uniref:FK506-binding protein 5-like n=1 Tax=Mytilus edulis TaxID=6550 RepID=UPI0039EE681C
MQRRRGRDPMDNLELGNQINFSGSIPMRKLTRMKIVKYLILILAAVLIHTTYRFFWKSDESVIDVPQSIPTIKDNQDKKVEEEIDSFKARSGNIENLYKDSLMEEKQILSRLKEKRKRYESFKKSIDKAKNEIHIEQAVDTNDIMDLDQSDQSKYEIKPENKDSIKQETEYDIKQENKDDMRKVNRDDIRRENKDDIIHLEQLEIVEDKQQEAKALEREHNIESKIAEILDEVKIVSEEKVEDEMKVDLVALQREEEELKKAEKFIDDKPAVIPSANPVFLEKANKVVEKMEVEIKGTMDVHEEHGIPEIVTAANSKDFEAVKQLVVSLQKFYPDKKIYIFDLDLTDRQRRHLMAACNVRIREFWSNLFPDFVSVWNHYHWKPLIIQTALAEFGHIMWINPGFVAISPAIMDVFKTSADLQVRVLGQNSPHTTHAVTHRQMYKYLPTDRKKLYHTPHMEIFALILHNSENVINKFMKLLVACAMEPKCLAPQSAKWKCDFDFSGKEYADCHRYDESAMNILLKNWFEFDNSKILKSGTIFRPFDRDDRMHLKMCRDEHDMK